jgi:hypothetical protein
MLFRVECQVILYNENDDFDGLSDLTCEFEAVNLEEARIDAPRQVTAVLLAKRKETQNKNDFSFLLQS